MSSGRTQHQSREIPQWKLRRTDSFDRRPTQFRMLQGRNIRPSLIHNVRRYLRRRHPIDKHQPVRKRNGHLHYERKPRQTFRERN